VAESVVVVEIFVAQTESEDALFEECGEGMLDAFGIAMVGEAGGELVEESELGFDFAEQERAGVGGDATALEVGENLA
jgi:hypothetical protein